MSTHPQQLDKYELHERLGRGGMAEVWKAFDRQLQRYVAIKLLHANLQQDPAFMTRFVREARTIASLRHPNIVHIYDFQTSDPSESSNPFAYMVMEYIEGQTLAQYLRNTSRPGKMPPAAELVNLFASISSAIDYAHQHGMIHRDIKPANILLDQPRTTRNPMGEPILADFGIAKLMGNTSSTVTGSWLGTPMYTSPEQAHGQPGNERSDLYSLGVILYEMCTGVPPFHGETMASILVQHITAAPPAPIQMNPDMPLALSGVILCALAKDPEARFSSASELTAAVAEALDMTLPSYLSLPSSPLATINAPAILAQPSGISPGEVLPASADEPFVTLAANATPLPASRLPEGQHSAEPPVLSTPVLSSLADTDAPLSPATPIPPAPPSTPVPGKKRRGWLIAVIALLIVIVPGSGLGAVYWFSHNTHPTPTVTANQVVGHVFLLSSGQVNEQSSQGINDELQVDLGHLSLPAHGKAFYAWLLSDKKVTEPTSILLTTLTVTNGGVQFHYTGDAAHTNLLEYYSRFLITQEDASPTPIAPSLDQRNWRYYAELPQIVNPADNFSLLDHLRHLLAKDPTLESLSLPGGLDIWLFRNTKKVMEWTGSARDCWQGHDTTCIHSNLVRILDYLSGKVYVQTDVPAGTPNLVNPRIAPVALLEFDPQNQNPPGYLYHINKHLRGIIQAPGVTLEQRQLAAQISTELNTVTNWLEQVRQDAKKLMAISQAQWLSPASLSILNDMETQASYAYTGQLDPNTNQNQGGVLQIHHDIERLATFDVTAYTPQ